MNCDIKSPWIQLTNRCNLHCTYCWVHKDDRVMELSVLRRINRRYGRLLDKGIVKHVQYRLAGGEPLLVLHRFMPLLDEMFAAYPNQMHAELITNGTLMDAEVLRFLRRNHAQIGLCCSLDGMIESKPDGRGHSTARAVRAMLARLRRSAPEIGVSISTVVRDNGIHLPALARFVSCHRYYWDVNLDHMDARGLDLPALKGNLSAMVDVLRQRKYPITRLQFNGIDFRPNAGCGAGKRLVAIDVDGRTFPCQTLFGRKSWRTYDRRKCGTCPITGYCGGGCKYNLLGDRAAFCEANKHFFLVGGRYAVTL